MSTPKTAGARRFVPLTFDTLFYYWNDVGEALQQSVVERHLTGQACHFSQYQLTFGALTLPDVTSHDNATGTRTDGLSDSINRFRSIT